MKRSTIKRSKKMNIMNAEQKTASYGRRLRTMLESDQFQKHNVYPTINAELVYAVIAMCLELKEAEYSKDEIIAFSNTVFEKRRRFFDQLIKLIDCLPNCFAIVRKWNLNDHKKRLKDSSIRYDSFTADKRHIEYRISDCMYVRMFEAYGIRELCKIFCNTDTRCYSGLTRHVQFTRHSDLSDGDTCWDEINQI